MAMEVGVGEGHTSRGATKNLWCRRPAAAAEVKAWSGTDIGMAPAIENDSGDIPARVEPASREEPHELFADLHLVLTVARLKELHPRRGGLLPERRPRTLKGHVEREDGGFVGMKRRTVVADHHGLPQAAAESKPVAVARRGDAQLI